MFAKGQKMQLYRSRSGGGPLRAFILKKQFCSSSKQTIAWLCVCLWFCFVFVFVWIYFPCVIVNIRVSELPFILASKAGADIFSEDMDFMSVKFSSFVHR